MVGIGSSHAGCSLPALAQIPLHFPRCSPTIENTDFFEITRNEHTLVLPEASVASANFRSTAPCSGIFRPPA